MRHNIFEESTRLNLRVMSENGVMINECNDDGENRAGEWVLEPLMVKFRNQLTNFNSICFS
jgi:hypothetical protein